MPARGGNWSHGTRSGILSTPVSVWLVLLRIWLPPTFVMVPTYITVPTYVMVPTYVTALPYIMVPMYVTVPTQKVILHLSFVMAINLIWLIRGMEKLCCFQMLLLLWWLWFFSHRFGSGHFTNIVLHCWWALIIHQSIYHLSILELALMLLLPSNSWRTTAPVPSRNYWWRIRRQSSPTPIYHYATSSWTTISMKWDQVEMAISITDWSAR